MSEIVRLENVPEKADAIDICQFFQGLQISNGTLLE